MTREEMELLAGLNQICAKAPAFALGFPDNGLPVIDELEFGCQLIDIARGILRHARQRGLPDGDKASTVEALPTQNDFIIDDTGYTVLDDPACPEG